MAIERLDRVEHTLNALHKDAQKDFLRMGAGVLKAAFRSLIPADFKDAYLPISKEQGITLGTLIEENNCKNVVEFGTSFGISTIYLAKAVRKTGGLVITTELIESKAFRALNNIANAGVSDFVDLRIGDAMMTLKDLDAPIDFLFLDGWKDLYLPLFQMLEPLFHAGTLIYADNIDMPETLGYADYVISNSQTYRSSFLHDGKGILTRMSNK